MADNVGRNLDRNARGEEPTQKRSSHIKLTPRVKRQTKNNTTRKIIKFLYTGKCCDYAAGDVTDESDSPVENHVSEITATNLPSHEIEVVENNIVTEQTSLHSEEQLNEEQGDEEEQSQEQLNHEQGIEEQGIEEQGIEEQGIEEQGTEEQGIEEQGTEEQGIEEQGIEEQGIEEQGIEEQGIEEQGIEEQGIEEQGTEEQGIEEQGTEKQGNQEQGTEEQGIEEQGIEEQGTEEQGIEEQGNEEQGIEEQLNEEQGIEEQGIDEQEKEEQGTEEQGNEEQGTEEQLNQQQNQQQGNEKQLNESQSQNRSNEEQVDISYIIAAYHKLTKCKEDVTKLRRCLKQLHANNVYVPLGDSEQIKQVVKVLVQNLKRLVLLLPGIRLHHRIDQVNNTILESISVFLHGDQTSESYMRAFNGLNKTVMRVCLSFYGIDRKEGVSEAFEETVKCEDHAIKLRRCFGSSHADYEQIKQAAEVLIEDLKRLVVVLPKAGLHKRIEQVNNAISEAIRVFLHSSQTTECYMRSYADIKKSVHAVVKSIYGLYRRDAVNEAMKKTVWCEGAAIQLIKCLRKSHLDSVPPVDSEPTKQAAKYLIRHLEELVKLLPKARIHNRIEQLIDAISESTSVFLQDDQTLDCYMHTLNTVKKAIYGIINSLSRFDRTIRRMTPLYETFGYIYDDEAEQADGDLCSVCQYPRKSGDHISAFLTCQHRFHWKCFLLLAKHKVEKCPLCNQSVYP